MLFRPLYLGAGFTGTFKKVVSVFPGLKCCFKDLMWNTIAFNNFTLCN